MSIDGIDRELLLKQISFLHEPIQTHITTYLYYLPRELKLLLTRYKYSANYNISIKFNTYMFYIEAYNRIYKEIYELLIDYHYIRDNLYTGAKVRDFINNVYKGLQCAYRLYYVCTDKGCKYLESNVKDIIITPGNIELELTDKLILTLLIVEHYNHSNENIQFPVCL